MSDADKVWNRAAMGHDSRDRRRGDSALSAALSFHNLAMNGGMLHAYESHELEARRAAIDGYRYLGLDSAAAVLEWLEVQAVEVDLESDMDGAERIELEADERYSAVVPDDATLVSAFESRFRTRPEEFAPQ